MHKIAVKIKDKKDWKITNDTLRECGLYSIGSPSNYVTPCYAIITEGDSMLQDFPPRDTRIIEAKDFSMFGIDCFRDEMYVPRSVTRGDIVIYREGDYIIAECAETNYLFARAKVVGKHGDTAGIEALKQLCETAVCNGVTLL